MNEIINYLTMEVKAFTPFKKKSAKIKKILTEWLKYKIKSQNILVQRRGAFLE